MNYNSIFSDILKVEINDNNILFLNENDFPNDLNIEKKLIIRSYFQNKMPSRNQSMDKKSINDEIEPLMNKNVVLNIENDDSGSACCFGFMCGMIFNIFGLLCIFMFNKKGIYLIGWFLPAFIIIVLFIAFGGIAFLTSLSN